MMRMMMIRAEGESVRDQVCRFTKDLFIARLSHITSLSHRLPTSRSSPSLALAGLGSVPRAMVSSGMCECTGTRRSGEGSFRLAPSLSDVAAHAATEPRRVRSSSAQVGHCSVLWAGQRGARLARRRAGTARDGRRPGRRRSLGVRRRRRELVGWRPRLLAAVTPLVLSDLAAPNVAAVLDDRDEDGENGRCDRKAGEDDRHCVG